MGRYVRSGCTGRIVKKCILLMMKVRAIPFLSSIYKMACPVGVELETISTEEAGKRWQLDQLGDLEPIFVLFKNMPMAYKAYKAGFRYATLQVGGIGGGVGRKNIVGPISFDDNDAKMLDEMFQDGLEAYFQPVPDN